MTWCGVNRNRHNLAEPLRQVFVQGGDLAMEITQTFYRFVSGIVSFSAFSLGHGR